MAMKNEENNTSKSSDDSNNYQIRPNLCDSFKVAAVKEVIVQTMHELLEGNNIDFTFLCIDRLLTMLIS